MLLSVLLPVSLSVSVWPSATAWAESTATSKARADIAQDIARGDFEQGIKKADAALKKTDDANEQAHLQLLKAKALLALGRQEKAKAAFALAVQRDPTVELDPAHAGPDAVRLLDKVRDELPATLVVVMKAGDADVEIDDKALGPAPLQTQVPGGVHVVLARGSDGRTSRVEAKVPAGRKVVLELELESQASTDAPKKVAPPPRDQPPAPDQAVRLQPVPPAVARSSTAMRPLGLGMMIGGGAALVAGGVVLGIVLDLYIRLGVDTFDPGEGAIARDRGNQLQPVAWTLLGAGAAVAGAGALMYFKFGSTAVALAPTRGGALLGISGVLP